MGTSAESLQKKVAKLAVLQAQATMIHLKCIEETKNILTKEQLLFLLSQKKRTMRDGQKSIKATIKNVYRVKKDNNVTNVIKQRYLYFCEHYFLFG